LTNNERTALDKMTKKRNWQMDKKTPGNFCNLKCAYKNLDNTLVYF